MALTLSRELIEARFPRPVKGNTRGMTRLTPAQTRAWLQRTLEAIDGEDLWLFAYGSLLWKPGFEFVDRRIARVPGFHRRFCLWQWRYRGNCSNPNLMMALEPGGSSRGIVYRIGAPDVAEKVRETWHREMLGDGYRPRWVTALTSRGRVRAVTFVANRSNRERYAGRLPDEEVARYIAGACGEKGSGAEYVLDTVIALERLGIRDSMLWRLQRLVAGHLAG